MATLKGNVEIRQGSLLIRADVAQVEKVEGKVRRFELTGTPVLLQQDIENEGLVSAQALKIDYVVATGIVTLSGSADVVHPQYRISGEVLEYDMNSQHFKGSGGDNSGRIRIRLDPEVVPGSIPKADDSSGDTPDSPDTATESEESEESEESGESG
jgi:lipopolysaccharide export system protein LptA